MVTNVAKASTTQGKRLQADTFATPDLAIGSEVTDFTNDFSPEFLWLLPCFAIANRKEASQGSIRGLSITKNPAVKKEMSRVGELEHVLPEKVDQLF